MSIEPERSSHPSETSTRPDTDGARSRPKSHYQDFFDAPWVGSVFRPILIALVAASLVAGPVALLRVMGTTWQLGYVLPCALLAALEGVYSTLRLGRPSWRDRRGLIFRLGEIVLLLVLFRIAVWAFSAGWPGLDDLKLWLRQPVAFLDIQYAVAGVTDIEITVADPFRAWAGNCYRVVGAGIA